MKITYLFFVILLFVSGNALCQIEGDVRDNANNRISKALIIAIDSTKNFADSVTSNENGFYRFTNLKPGKYLIEAKASGFLTRQYKSVEARVRMNNPEAGSDISNATRLQIILSPVKEPKQ